MKMSKDMNTSVVTRKMLSSAICIGERRNWIRLKLLLLQLMDDVTMLFYDSREICLEQFQIVSKLLVFNKKLLMALVWREIFGSLVIVRIIDGFILSKARV